MGVIAPKLLIWLLFVSYLLVGVGGPVSHACAEGRGSSAGALLHGKDCCPHPSALEADPAGCCTDRCGEDASLSHLRSVPGSKRLLHSPFAPCAFRVPAPPLSAAAKVEPPPCRALLPNPTLAALRTVVLLN